ncbi:uncharacterized protein L3040_007618 [Drepanopeziza brunnea f. sp. 'multigermtubi']|uniref:uncharacterized protein n=1 Tax=Drepanopeziza brunnea f. sp. 'multigermtubi' TaxID=698441 RepID=UPI002397BD69|nr:hypothetical protein L3040_007618 [Drepanopeziza brunnea f. sp. 'multigermtubi']
MDKRKVNGAAPSGEELDDRAAKRRKMPGSDLLSQGESPETTTQMGLKLLDTFRQTADKSGRLIATPFLTLPSKKQFPDYYEMIKMPIALDTIEAKLKRHEFPNLTTLESYFKRMISNAKEYNTKDSEIYEDSERLRKALSNYMTKHNPAYKLIPGYSAFATPLPTSPAPASTEGAGEEDAPGEADVRVQTTTTKKARGRLPRNSQPQRKSVTPNLPDTRFSVAGYHGLTFQEAQEKFVDDLIAQKEFPEDTIPEYLPFLELPSREEYPDYYEVIDHPVSLRTLKKGTKGIRGKAAATGVSSYQSWGAFEHEASHIWKNAIKFNKDGSPIFLLAHEFKVFFTKVFPEIKKVVPDGAPAISPKISAIPPKTPALPPRIKLKTKSAQPPPKITLRMPGRPSPADSPAPQPIAPAPVAIQAANGTSGRNPFASAVPAPSLDQLERARSASGSVASPTPSHSASVKNEEASRNSPAVQAPLNTFRGSNHAVSTPGIPANGMLPPSTPGQSTTHFNSVGYAQSFNHQAQYTPPNPGFDSKWRQAGKTAADAMITNLCLATHPGLNISRHFRMDLPPSPVMAQQSITINLPSTHYYLQIKPTIAPSLLERQHKLFVTSGTQRLNAMPLIPGHPVDPRHPLFEARLLPGVNRIELELIAALPKGSGKPASGQDVELEKITVFANLLR